jgi:hypothetical protein
MNEEPKYVESKCPFCGVAGKKLQSMFSSMLYCPDCGSGWFPN